MLLGLVKPICYIAENGVKSRSCFDSPREAELLNGKKQILEQLCLQKADLLHSQNPTFCEAMWASCFERVLREKKHAMITFFFKYTKKGKVLMLLYKRISPHSELFCRIENILELYTLMK